MKNKLPTLAIIASGFLPVPASKGGAVEALCENFLKENERQKKINIVIYSNHDTEAIEKSKKYNYSNFKFIKIAKSIEILDLIAYSFFKKIFPKRNTSSFRYIFQRLYFIIKVAKDLSKNNYDKILFENQAVQLLALKIYSNYDKYKNRFVFHVHNQITNMYGCKKYIQFGYNIAVSHYISNSLQALLGNDSIPKNHTVLRNCVNEKDFSHKLSNDDRSKLLEKFGIKANEKVLLFVGRLTPEKGIDQLVSALYRVKYKHYKLLIVGSSFFGTDIKNPFTKTLEQIAQPIKDKLVFTGYIDYVDMPKIYALADVAVLPSVGIDAAPLTIIEAIVSGLPIITTMSGGIPEYANDKYAIILNIDDQLVDNLAKHIDRLMSDRRLYATMRLESLNAAKDLTLENYYNNMLSGLNIERLNNEL
jgi:glycosyltransferase involved in cell wall biosynthesis